MKLRRCVKCCQFFLTAGFLTLILPLNKPANYFKVFENDEYTKHIWM